MPGDITINGKVLPLGSRTFVMGVLNVTPDSFSDGGSYFDRDKAVERALEMEEQGADIIDIGGESTRPGSRRITTEEELARVIPVIKALRGRLRTPISIDTAKAEVARQAVSEGAAMINDITSLRGDKEMPAIAARTGAYVVLMHMKGTPENMQRDPSYEDVVQDITDHLRKAVKEAADAGIDPDHIIIDPGIGFGKALEHNLMILKELSTFRELGKPLLVGTSRKAFIGELTGRDVGSRGFGTAASVAIAAANGADIVRVHDVSMAKDVTRVVDAVRRI